MKVRALDDGHEVPISNAWMHSDYPDIAFVDLGPDPVLPDPVDYVLEVEMAENKNESIIKKNNRKSRRYENLSYPVVLFYHKEKGKDYDHLYRKRLL